MSTASERLTVFLEENSKEFLHNWRSRIVMAEDDFYKDEAINNGIQMFELIKKALNMPLNDDAVKRLAYKTAQERVSAKVNISEFVYNMNIGKSEVVKWAGNSGIELKELQPLINKINDVFDRFSYFAVRRYSEIKEKEIEEKDLYIDQTHKERLTILGQMSSSFVHEFRNPLTSIIGFTKLLQDDYPNHPYLDIMHHELDQLNYRISQFLHVSRKELFENERKQLNLRLLLDELIEFIYPSLLDGEVSMELNIDQEINLVADKDEIRQVFLNLIMNSIDALQEKTNNRNITITSELTDHFIHVKLCNNGPAIPKEVVEVIFEPFYTTKDLGTGIGLYICKKLIEKHHGEISCHSSEANTEFLIKLPRI
ncbi:histidine kinase N-terminal domain-containing protein [Bacillus spongiae]|uniref:histidine kinase n=1 Tax=Bacillus spongiae TaxID=2683610 RepID=A0ABU8HFX4_9BACI